MPKLLKLTMALTLLVASISCANDLNYNLESLTELALEGNPKIKQAALQKEMQIEEVKQVGELPDPTLSYSWFGESVETRVGPQKQKFSVQQKLPWLGRLTDQKELARKKAKVSETLVSSEISKIVFEIRKAWSAIQYLNLSVNTLDSTVKLYRAWSKKLLSDYKSGKVSLSQILKMENEVDLLEDEKRTALRYLKDEVAFLAEIAGHGVSVEALTMQTFEAIVIASGMDEFPAELTRNSNLLNSKAQKEFWKQREKLSENGYVPNFTVGFGYIQTGEFLGMAESGKDPWSVSLAMTIPLSYDKTSASIKEAQLGFSKASAFENEQSLLIERIMQQSIHQLEEASRKRNLYKNSLLVRLEQSIAVLEKEYQTGGQDFMQLLDDYRQRLVLKRKIYKTLNQEFQSKAKLLWLLGDESTKYSFPYSFKWNESTETEGM